MKKMISAVMSLVLLVCLTACNPGNLKTISHGTIDGNVYSSEFTGITFTKPDSWKYSTDEEIAATMDVTADMFKDENYAEAVKGVQNAIDMMVVDNDTGTNINITYENLAMSNNQDITEEKYLDVTLDTVASQTTMDVELSDEADVTLCGEQYHRAILDVSYSGIEMQQVYYMRKIDNYMVNVVVTLVSGYSIEDVEAMFS